jgi:thiamine transport system ATP-binding protein
VLTVDDVTVRYGSITALERVSLTVADGEILCVLGPSGSGKTTLLRAIAGLESPSHGGIRWDDHDLTRVPPHRRGLGLMFQDHALFPHRDVLGNVLFGLRMKHLPSSRAEARAREILALVGLGGAEHRRVHELSGGEQQRVALARALAPAPRLLMLDEPLGSLDRALRDRLVVELRDLFTTLGLTTLFVTHDHDEAFALADRVAIMHAGHVEQVGPATDVWNRPATEFVAGFLGYNVTNVFGRRAAVLPDRIRIVYNSGTGSVVGVVVARTFRRDHFLLRVKVAEGAPLEVAVRDVALPEIGDTVQLDADADALVALGDAPPRA